MINEKAIKVAEAIDDLAEEEFGDSYTIHTIFWNDGDFRITAYSAKDIPASRLPGDYKQVYVELRYQDSKLPMGLVRKVRTTQKRDGSRSEPDLVELGDVEVREFVPKEYGITG